MQPTRLRARHGQPRFQRAFGAGSLCVASSTSAHRKNAIVRRFLGDVRSDLKPWRCHHTRWSTFNQDARIEVLKEPSCVKPQRWCFPPPVRATRLGKPHSRATRVRTRNLIRRSVPKPAKIYAPAVTTKTVLKNLYKSSQIGPNPLFSSCFIEAGFVPLRRAEPEPSSPQASLAKQETMAARPLKRIKPRASSTFMHLFA